MKNNFRLVITGGGTGGHLFPGIAVADMVMKTIPDSKILFVGTDRQVDARVLADRTFSTAAVKCQGLKGKSLLQAAKSLVRIPLAILDSLRILKEFKPDLVMGVGGYVTGPVVCAAKLIGVKTCIHEQNSIPGLANRLLGKIVDRVFISIHGSETFFADRKVVFTGNPLRQNILSCREKKTSSSGRALLVMGGSQGAHRVNFFVAGALKLLKDRLPEDFLVIHQTGKNDESAIRTTYEQEGINARVDAFIDDMETAYLQAGLVVSRAGATSLAEISAIGLPSILIPFPYAADNHQEFNARMISDSGGAVLLIEKDTDEKILAKTIIDMLENPEMLAAMGEKARSVSNPDATERIFSECSKLVGNYKESV